MNAESKGQFARNRPFGTMRRGWFVLEEAAANIIAWAMAVCLVIFTIGFASALATTRNITTAANAYNEIERMDTAGRHVLVVSPAIPGESLIASYCDSLRNRGGIKTAFGVGSGPIVKLGNGYNAPVMFTTKGFADFVSAPPTPTGLYVGASLAKLAGIENDSWVSLPRITGLNVARSVQVASTLSQSTRTANFDDSLVVVIPPTEIAVDECWVETESPVPQGITGSIGNVANNGLHTAIRPLKADLANRTEPEVTLAAVPGDLTSIMVGAGAAVILLAWWYIRRAEWALYRSFGIGTVRLVGVASAEWLTVIALAQIIGAFWGTAIAGTGHYYSAYLLGAKNVVMSVLVSAIAVPLWAGWLSRASVARVLRGT